MIINFTHITAYSIKIIKKKINIVGGKPVSEEKQNEEQVTMVKITNLSKEYKMFNRKIDNTYN